MKNQNITPFDPRLKPHEGRLVAERIFLANKLNDLQKFITGSREYPGLPHNERNLMLDQRDSMDRYLLILNQRIERIDLPPLEGNKTETPAPQPDPVMSPLLKERGQAKAKTETPLENVCDCNQCQLERKVAEMNKAQAMGVGELPFKKARQMNMISFDMSGPPLSDNMKKVLSDMLMKQAIKRVMGVDQGQAPQTEPVGMDPQADSFEAIQEPPMRRFQVQTVTTKTELTTIGAFDEQDAIARVSHGQGDTGKNQLTVTSTAQLFA
jgi:hypothetical protein